MNCKHEYIQVDSIWFKCRNCGLIIPANQTLFLKLLKKVEEKNIIYMMVRKGLSPSEAISRTLTGLNKRKLYKNTGELRS
jgi:hypothetical protein